ncbi:alpha/beta hydrolase [Aurantivibrio plasticivorans]
MKRLHLILPVIFISTVLQGCVFGVVDFVTPDDGYNRIDQISYGELKRQNVDYYWPAKTPYQNTTIVFFYGGGWQSGKKENYRFVAQALTSEGFRVAIPDYRVYPEVSFPRFVEDAADAVATIQTRYPDSTLVLMGHSAGAHIAAMLVSNPQYLLKAGADAKAVAAWVGLSGPYDFLPLQSKRLKKVFAGAEDLKLTQPIHFVNSNIPPTLLVQGLDDSTVIPRNTERLAAALEEHSVPHRVIYYEDVGHAGTVGAMAPILGSWSNVLPDVLEFLKDVNQSSPLVTNLR